jgi:RNA polymerase sigma-70 factor (ECF subfamily)
VRDASGFEEFYRETQLRVLRHLCASAGDVSEAQDAVAEAYARAWQHWDTVGRATNPEAWVRVVARRTLTSDWRKVQGRMNAYRRHGPPPESPPVSEDSVALVSALRRLGPDQRMALFLFHMVELSVAEIAARTGVPVGTVKARLSRGRHALSAWLRLAESGAPAARCSASDR